MVFLDMHVYKCCFLRFKYFPNFKNPESLLRLDVLEKFLEFPEFHGEQRQWIVLEPRLVYPFLGFSFAQVGSGLSPRLTEEKIGKEQSAKLENVPIYPTSKQQQSFCLTPQSDDYSVLCIPYFSISLNLYFQTWGSGIPAIAGPSHTDSLGAVACHCFWNLLIQVYCALAVSRNARQTVSRGMVPRTFL